MIGKKSQKNILIYRISYEPLIGPKPLRIKFDKINGFIMVLDDKIEHLVLFYYGLLHNICDKIKYLK